MRINWGTGIAFFYATFMVTMIYMVYQSTQHDINLVVDNYYEKDLSYQSHLDRIKNTKKLGSDLKIIYQKDQEIVRFIFPEEVKKVEGEVLFYRASDSKQDVHSKIAIDQNHEYILPIPSLQKGNWKVKVDWSGDQIPFYQEINIQIP